MSAQASRSERVPLIAIATHSTAAGMTTDDAYFVQPLRKRCGARVEAVPWDTDRVRWERYDAVLIRSTWDYYLDPTRFVAWVERIESTGIAIWNEAAVIRWNTDKRYLRELGRVGVSVVPTEWIPRGSTVDLPSLLRERGWTQAVVKPSVAATAYRTWRTSSDVRDPMRQQALLAAVLAEADALVQPFLESIVRDGEWSFVYFDNDGLTFSHAVLKHPADGDFRVQGQFGGSVRSATPSAALRSGIDEVAAVVNRLVPGPILYARFDGVVSDGTHAPPGTFLLMEAELIEPILFLGSDPNAADRFAAAVARRLPAERGVA